MPSGAGKLFDAVDCKPFTAYPALRLDFVIQRGGVIMRVQPFGWCFYNHRNTVDAQAFHFCPQCRFFFHSGILQKFFEAVKKITKFFLNHQIRFGQNASNAAIISGMSPVVLQKWQDLHRPSPAPRSVFRSHSKHSPARGACVSKSACNRRAGGSCSILPNDWFWRT
jgi:hypothetical protein